MTKAKLILLALVISAKCFAQTAVTRTVQANLDTLVTTTTVSSVTLKYKPPVVTPPNTGGMVTIGKVASGPVTLKSNTNYNDLIIDLKGSSQIGIQGNGVSNVHIHKVKIMNGTNFGILLQNSKNITIDSCFITNIGFGVYAVNNCVTIKVNNNQILNVNGINATALGHAIQFNGVSGTGNQINYNKVENIAGKALHPHDQLTLFKASGTVSDPIQVIGNWVRGGQQAFWPGSTASQSGACGIGYGDEGGAHQLIKNNIVVNPGFIGMQNGYGQGGDDITLDGNIIVGDVSPIAGAGLVYQPGGTNFKIINNKVWYVRPNGARLDFNQASKTGATYANNQWGTVKMDASVLPAKIITFQ